MMLGKKIGAVATVTVFGVFSRLLGFIFKIYLSRTLGAEALGLYQIALSVFLLFAAISSSGIPTILSTKVSEEEALGNKNTFSLFTSALLYSVSLAAVLAIVLSLLGDRLTVLFSDPLACPVFLIMIPSLVSTAVYCTVRGWFWGKKLFNFFAVTETLEEALRILLTVLFIGGVFGSFSGATAIAWAFTVSDIAVAILLTVLFFIKGGTVQKPSDIKKIFFPSLPITAMRVSSGLFGAVIALLLPSRLVALGWTNGEATAAFGRVCGMANPLLFVPNAVTGSIAIVLLPDISGLAVKKNYAVMNRQISAGVNFSLLLCGFFMALYLGTGEKITLLLYGDGESGKYLSIAALSMIPVCLAQMTQSVLNSVGKEKQAFLSYAIGNLFLLGCIFLLPRYIGIYSVAVADAVGFCVIATLNTLTLHRMTGWGSRSLKYCLASFAFALLCGLLTRSFLPLTENMGAFLSVFIPASVCLCAYLLLIAAVGFVDIKSVFSRKRKYAKQA